MPTRHIRDLVANKVDGFGAHPGNSSRIALTASDGSTILLVSDITSGGADRIQVYHVTGDNKGTSALVATLTPPSTDMKGGFTAALFNDDDVALLVKSEDKQSLRYCRVNKADWSQGAWETMHDHTGQNKAEVMDIDVSDAGAVYVCWNQSGTDSASSRIKVRTTGGTWTAVRDVSIMSGGVYRKVCEAASIVTLGTGSAGSIRNVVFLNAAGKPGVDTGILLYSIGINESNGAIPDAAVLRATFMQNEVDAGSTATASQRHAALFRGAGNDFLLGMMHRAVNKKIGAFKATYHDGAWTIVNQLDTATIPDSPQGNSMGMTARHNSAAAAEHTINFYYRKKLSDVQETVHEMIGKIGTSNIVFTGPYVYGHPSADKMTEYSVRILGGGGKKNLDKGKHEILVQYSGKKNAAAANHAYLLYADVLPNGSSSIVATVPAHEGVIDSAQPTLSVSVDDDVKYAQSKQKVQWQFDTTSGFVAPLSVDYTQADNKFVKIEGTHSGSLKVTITDTVPISAGTLTGGTYFMRARMIDEWGNVGSWTSTRTVTVIHPPTFIPKAPISGQYLNFGDGQVTFTWDSTDPSTTDVQTAYQIEAYEADGTLIFNSGKITSAVETHTHTFSATYKNLQLYWIGRVWDSNDTPSAYSDPEFFILVDPPSATIVSPTNNQVVDTGMPDIVAQITVGGSRTVKEITYLVTKAGVPVWSAKKFGTWTTGDQVVQQVEANKLSNNTEYSVQVTVRDNVGLVGQSAIRTFQVAWIPPDPATDGSLDDSAYNSESWLDEPGGYVEVSWEGDRDADFFSWNIYRRDDLIDASTGELVEEGTYKLIHRSYDNSSFSQTFRDYYAPAEYQVWYSVRQQVNLNGQDIESDDFGLGYVIPSTDAYWIVIEATGPNAVEVIKFNVNQDDFTDEMEEAEFVVIGRGRVVNRGEILGPKGSLTTKIRNSGTKTARKKRLDLLEAQQTHRKVYLRNPFGDVFRVALSQMSVSRVVGVGKSEYVDVTIPYSKVSQK